MLPHLFVHLRDQPWPRKPRKVAGMRPFLTFPSGGGAVRSASEPSDQALELMRANNLVNENGRAAYVWPPAGPQHVVDSIEFQLGRAPQPTRKYHCDTVDVLASGFPYPVEVRKKLAAGFAAALTRWNLGKAPRVQKYAEPL